MIAYPSSNGDARLADLLDQYVAALHTSTPLSKRDLVAAHPDLAEQLEDCLASLEFIRGAAGDRNASIVETNESLGSLGDFRIVREIGRGGMGVVYEAEQTSLRRRVAIKVLPFAATLDSRQLERFKNEAVAAATLHHTNIVPVYATGVDCGIHYYAMQFIEGESLAQVIEKLRANEDGGQDLDKKGAAFHRHVAELGMQAAEALEHAHQRGIIHRDVKPGNLLLDARGNLWLSDFGLAQIRGSVRLTLSGDVVGTLRYSSPEQILGPPGNVDHRTDTYSLGATLYELLTQRPVVAGESREEVLRRLASDVQPTSLPRSVPADLSTIVMKSLARVPAERYATARDMADDLRAFLTAKPIMAKPPSWPRQAWRWLRRHRKAARAAVVGALLMAVATVILLVSLQSRHQAETATNQQQARQALRELIAVMERSETAGPQGGPGPQELQQVLQFYETLAPTENDDPAFRHEVAKLARLLGDYQERQKERNLAAQAYVRATDQFDQLAAEFPTDPIYREELALTWQRRMKLGPDRAAREDAWTKVRDLWQQLVTEQPDEPRHRYRLALHYVQSVGQGPLAPADAQDKYEAKLRAGIALLENLNREYPDNRQYGGQLFIAGSQLANHFQKTKRGEAAEALRDRIQQRQQQVLRGGALPRFQGGLLDDLNMRRTVMRTHEQFGILELVQLPQIQLLLGVSGEEAKRVASLLDGYRRQVDDYYRRMEELEPRHRPTFMGWEGSKQRQLQETEVKAILGEPRATRLEQVQLQLVGISNLMNLALAKEFEVSNDQRTRMMQRLQDHVRDPQQEQRLLEVLTEAQREQWRQKIGEPLKPELLQELKLAASALANPTYPKPSQDTDKATGRSP